MARSEGKETLDLEISIPTCSRCGALQIAKQPSFNRDPGTGDQEGIFACGREIPFGSFRLYGDWICASWTLTIPATTSLV